MKKDFKEFLSKKYCIKFVCKQSSLLMFVISKILFFNKKFMTDYLTTVGSTIYYPQGFDFVLSKSGDAMLFHEFLHVWDYRQNKALFIIKYLFPQILSLFALFAFISPGFLLCLLFLLPLPSATRTKYELRGYLANIFYYHKIFGYEIESTNAYLEGIVENFTGPNYYFMCRSMSVKRLKEEYKMLLKQSNLFNIYPYYAVYDYFKNFSDIVL